MDPFATTEIDDNLLEVIARSLPRLRPSDRRVAEAILAAPEAAVGLTLAALAERAGVSEPTVVRFTAAVGCEGFRDMRVKLARSLAFARTTSHAAISPQDDLAAIVGKIFDFNLSNLAWARSRLDPASVAAAVDALERARRIEFFGFGASGVVAGDAQQKFPLFGIPTGAPSDPHQMMMTAAMLGPGDAAVAVSHTGQTPEIVAAARLAREKGATTIAITGATGPLGAACAIEILVETLENTDLYTPTVSRLSAMVVVDILAIAVSLRRSGAHRRRVAEMKERLAGLRGGQGDPRR